MSCGVSKIWSVNYNMLHGESSDTSGQKCTLYGVKRTVYYKKARYMDSIKTCQLQECTLYGVKKDLSPKEGTEQGVNKNCSVTRMHVIWGQKGLVYTRKHVFLLLGDW